MQEFLDAQQLINVLKEDVVVPWALQAIVLTSNQCAECCLRGLRYVPIAHRVANFCIANCYNLHCSAADVLATKFLNI